MSKSILKGLRVLKGTKGLYIGPKIFNIFWRANKHLQDNLQFHPLEVVKEKLPLVLNLAGKIKSARQAEVP